MLRHKVSLGDFSNNSHPKRDYMRVRCSFILGSFSSPVSQLLPCIREDVLK